jgi:6-phosphofructo-2-kinase/fructose-2,6-biphosphatase
MPAAEGAVAAAAVADQMYGPKEDRKLVIVLVISRHSNGSLYLKYPLCYLLWLLLVG